MTVNDLILELQQLKQEGYGQLNVAYNDDASDYGKSSVDKVKVLVESNRIGKYVYLYSSKIEN